MAHTIRLCEPWGVAPRTNGKLELQRWFQCPPAVRAADHVWLTITGLPGAIEVLVNGELLDHSGRSTADFRQDIRTLVQARNKVVIRLIPKMDVSSAIDRFMDNLRHQVLAAGLVRLEIE